MWVGAGCVWVLGGCAGWSVAKSATMRSLGVGPAWRQACRCCGGPVSTRHGKGGSERLDGARERGGLGEWCVRWNCGEASWAAAERFACVPSKRKLPHSPRRDGSVQDCSMSVSHPLGGRRVRVPGGGGPGEGGRGRTSALETARSEAANSRRSGCSFEAEDSPPGQLELHVSPAGLMRVVALGAGGARPGRELPPQRC